MKALERIKSAISDIPIGQGRRVIAIAGPPASGKSTLAQWVHEEIPGSAVLPMDGFHKSNQELQALGLLARKGAPNTFDVGGLIHVVESARRGDEVEYPIFDRETDSVIQNGGVLTDDHHTVLVEGNYLLLDTRPWNKLAEFWDFSIMLDVPVAELESRLMERWLSHGYDQKTALKKTKANDLPNAVLVGRHSISGDMVINESESV